MVQTPSYVICISIAGLFLRKLSFSVERAMGAEGEMLRRCRNSRGAICRFEFLGKGERNGTNQRSLE